MRTARDRIESIALPLLLTVAAVAVWAVCVRLSGTRIFPSPWKVALGVGELLERGLLLRYLRDSLLRVFAGYGAAVLLGLPLGAWMGWSEPAALFFNPVVQFLRPISPIAWIPIAIVLFGVGSLAPVFLVFLGAFFPIVVTAMNGVHGVPEMYKRAARNFGLPLWRVVLPAALPRVLAGLRIALGIAWLVLVAAEMIAVDSGLGYLIIDSRNAGQRYDLVVAGMLLIGIVGLLLDVLVRRVEKLHALRWGFEGGR